ncbi:MAG: amidohydrolase family protein [Verrucomicrobiae bacterium]|nr:amidohydrolase family protein [Verrucomicrobiae bacterium]
MNRTLIENVCLVFPGEKIERGGILFSEGVIEAVNPETKNIPEQTERVDGQGLLLTPGLIDLHTHGIKSSLYDHGPEAVKDGARNLPAFGVTGFFPTLAPHVESGFMEKLARLAGTACDEKDARMPGLHLEGPFMAMTGAGCQTIHGDVGLLREIIAACGGRLKIMSVSPDTPGILPVIECLVENGIAPFITHTRATVEQTEKAIAAGARHATHFYDVFPALPEFDPGVHTAGAVEAVLADERVSVDFIADGVHVHPVVVRMALKAKGFQNVILITDSNIGAGLPSGIHDTPWGFPVKVEHGNGARIHDPKHPCHGGLAGSALTMNLGIKNLSQWLNLPPEQVWAMGTSNPARVAGLKGFGRLERNAPADAVLWDDDFQAVMTWIGGQLVWKAPSRP